MKKNKLLVVLMLLFVFITSTFGGIFSVQAASVDYYVVFSNDNYSIRATNKLELADNGTYMLYDKTLNSSIGFYVKGTDGSEYKNEHGRDLTVEKTGNYSYDICFYKAINFSLTNCHITYTLSQKEQTQNIYVGDDLLEMKYSPCNTAYDMWVCSSVYLFAGQVIYVGDAPVVPDPVPPDPIFPPVEEEEEKKEEEELEQEEQEDQEEQEEEQEQQEQEEQEEQKEEQEQEEKQEQEEEQISLLSVVEDTREAHTVSVSGHYRVLYAPKTRVGFVDYAFDKDGNWGTGSNYQYEIYFEPARHYYIAFEDGIRDDCPSNVVIQGRKAFPLYRYEDNVSIPEYRTESMYVLGKDAELHYYLYERELNTYRLIDDDKDDEKEYSTITMRDGAYYSFSLVVNDDNYAVSSVLTKKRLGGFFYVGEFNQFGYGYNMNDYKLNLVGENDEDYSADYIQFKTYITVKEEDLYHDKFEFYITDGWDKYRNGTNNVSLNKIGMYKLLFSEEHFYGNGNRYRCVYQEEAREYIDTPLYNYSELQREAELCSRVADYSYNKRYILTSDISFEGKTVPTFKQFSGIFDGSGKTISGLNLSKEKDYVGMFQTLTRFATVQDLFVELNLDAENANYVGFVCTNYGTIQNVTVSGKVVGAEYVGGIVGYNGRSAVDENSTTESDVVQTAKIINCTNKATILAKANVGGITGFDLGEITSCLNEGNVIPQSGTRGATRANFGGIAGYSGGKITDCDNTAKIGNGKLAAYVGGIVGVSSGELYYSINHGEVNAGKYAGGIVGVYGQIAENTEDSNDFFSGMNFGEVLDRYYGQEEEESMPEGTSHGLAYLINYGIVRAGGYVGGILGYTTYEITLKNSVSDAELFAITVGNIGGIAGYTENATIETCVSSGVITLTGTSKQYAGGILGQGENVLGCASSIAIIGGDRIGGIAGSGKSIKYSYSNACLLPDTDAEEIGMISGTDDGFNASLASFEERYLQNYFVGEYGGVCGVEYGKYFDYAACSVKEEAMKVSVLHHLFNEEEYWQDGRDYPQLVSLLSVEHLDEIDDEPLEDDLFAKYQTEFASVSDTASKAVYTVLFLEWNEDNGSLMNDDDEVDFGNFDVIGRFYAKRGESVTVNLQYAERYGDGWMYRGDDAWYFVTLASVPSVENHTVVYAEYREVITSICNKEETVFVEGLFDVDTIVNYENGIISLTLDDKPVSLQDVSVKVKGEAEQSVLLDGTEVSAKRSGDYYAFSYSDGQTITMIQIKKKFPTWGIVAIVGGSVALIGVIVTIIIVSSKKKGRR